MNKKLITKIAASAASLTLLAGAITAPSNSFLSVMSPVTSIETVAYSSSTYTDSTGIFEVTFDNDSVVNGTFQGKEAYISGVVTSKIPQSGILTIPDQITVKGQNSKGYKFNVTRPVTEITQSAFSNKKSIIKVNFPSTLKKIDSYAFRNSGLVALELPSSITSIGNAAFQNCQGLYNVDFSGAQPNLAAFSLCDNLKYFNHSLILNHNPKTGEPILNEKVAQALNGISTSYDSVKKIPVITQYATEYINYIVKTNTKTSDRPIIKARKLHDWLIQHTEYDNEAAAAVYHSTAHDDWGPFFRRKSDGKYYAVCEGYAGAYKLLCDAAGIECYCVDGAPTSGKGISHMWNVVKIAGNYYHVDTTWDDKDQNNPYENFMRSDYAINKFHNYNWAGYVDNRLVKRSTGVATYDLRYLGYVNTDSNFDENDATEIQYYTLKLHELSPKQLMRADMNLDGTVDLSDAVFIRQVSYKMNQANYTKSPFEFVYIDGKMGI